MKSRLARPTTHALALLIILGAAVPRMIGMAGAEVIRPTLGVPRMHLEPVAEIGVHARNFVITGDHAFLPSSEGVRIIDVADPRASSEVGRLDGGANGVAVDGHLAVVACGDGGVRAFDVSDVRAPIELGAWDTPQFEPGEEIIRSVAMSGHMVFAVGRTVGWGLEPSSTGLWVIDVSNPHIPVQVGSFVEEMSLTWHEAWDIAVVGDTAYIAHMAGGLRIVDVSHPSTPVALGHCDTFDKATAVVVVDNTAYVADQGGGVRIIDVSNPRAPVEVGACSNYDTGGWAFDVAVADGMAYTAGEVGDLRAIDVSNPQGPVVLARCELPYDAYAVGIADGLVYVSGSHVRDGKFTIVERWFLDKAVYLPLLRG